MRNLSRILVLATTRSRAVCIRRYIQSTTTPALGEKKTITPKLVNEDTKQVYISTPIYYVNGAPHIGHLYTGIMADVTSRFYRSQGYDVEFATGTDEHGFKVQQQALKDIQSDKALATTTDPAGEGMADSNKILAFCDLHSNQFKKLCQVANIQYTKFNRTTSKDHFAKVQKFWNLIKENGFIYMGKHSGFYSVTDECFYTETDEKHITKIDSTDQNEHQQYIYTCPNTKTASKVEFFSEENYKFKLGLFKNKIKEYLFFKNNNVLVPPSRSNMLSSFLFKNIQNIPTDQHQVDDLSVSRPSSRVGWGIPVPGDASQTVYVWLDALANYLAPAHGKDSGNIDRIPDIQLMGKEIIKFHSIYWPAFLMAASDKYKLPQKIVVHGHFTNNGTKMSKSLGNVVDPFSQIEKYGSDALRYYLVKCGSFGSDNDYLESNIPLFYNKDLADHLGNLLSRSTSSKLAVDYSSLPLINNECVNNGATPADSRDSAIHTSLLSLPNRVSSCYADFDFALAAKTVLEHLAITNKYFSDNKPWILTRSDPTRLNTVIFYCLESIRICSILLYPIIPNKSTEILDIYYNHTKPADYYFWSGSALGSFFTSADSINRFKLGKIPILFNKL
ncbi:putative methionine-tRNA ligase, mitochondrial [Zancudomyces culisetae]|uniref:methionine--tRNA ligase n=1 Tax=Zancudomyces culisetae TaxID=1213189 RepID=A0A1R1PHZ9_ZANCU|nr:putative methionine-tRNA ligase, mitochondrial [Zancudomyces culisetae]|eukprot:OMH80625.1 putative methionine-tRNA ligase, mitochondrial [Zancudomyces culisetae]